MVASLITFGLLSIILWYAVMKYWRLPDEELIRRVRSAGTGRALRATTLAAPGLLVSMLLATLLMLLLLVLGACKQSVRAGHVGHCWPWLFARGRVVGGGRIHWLAEFSPTAASPRPRGTRSDRTALATMRLTTSVSSANEPMCHLTRPYRRQPSQLR